MTRPAVTLPPSLDHARALILELINQGVRHIVLSPGSRSAPLAYAAYCAEAGKKLQVHIKIDERSAGFFALGLARYDGVPAAVITTSGTAVANLHPAVLEAHHSGVPLIVLSADRPHELRGTGANQTTDQVGIFAGAVRLGIDLPAPHSSTPVNNTLSAVVRGFAAATGHGTNNPGPVQINCGFADPLAPTADQLSELKKSFTCLSFGREHTHLKRLENHPSELEYQVRPYEGDWTVAAIDDEPNTVVIAGDSAPIEAALLARSRGWPLLAEPSSGMVQDAIAHGPLILEHAENLAEKAVQIIVFGRPTLTRQIQRFMARPTVKLIIVADNGSPFIDPSRSANMVLYGLPEQWRNPQPETANPRITDLTWLKAWQQASALITGVLARLTKTDSVFSAQLIAQQIAQSVELHGELVVGSSSVIRDLDLYAKWPQEPVTLHANRGLAGIDGTISTALGIATASQEPLRAVMGDLTFLHDIGGLLRGPKQAWANLDLIVVNDQGGAIFAGLEHGQAGDEALFNRMFTTPHRANLAHLCAGYGVPHVRLRAAELESALTDEPNGVQVYEVMINSADRQIAKERLQIALIAAFAETDSGNFQ